jgi:hypothetical protein
MAAAVLNGTLNEAGVRGQGLSEPLPSALHRFALHPFAPQPSAPFRLAPHPFTLTKRARAAGRPTACAHFLSAKRRTRRSIRFCGAEAERAERGERSRCGSSL